MGKWIATFVVGAVFGGAVGFMLAPRESSLVREVVEREVPGPTNVAPVASATAAPTRDPAKAAPVPPAQRLDPAAAPSDARAAGDASVSVSDLMRENQQLRVLVSELEARAETEQKIRSQQDGEPLTAPPDLDPRFSEQALTTAVNDALRQAGVSSAQVTSVDCTEYPCIVYGEGMSQPEEFERLQGSTAFGAYRQDSASRYGFSTDGKDGKGPQQHFGLALFPRGETPERREALERRLKFRVEQMRQTFGR